MAHTPDARAARAPRFLRFACALALTSGVGATSGCYASHEGVPAVDAGSPRDARTIVRDAPPPRDVGPDVPVVVRTDAPLTCADCDCAWGVDTGPRPSCDDIGLWSCCAAIGPCAPPDLPA